VRFSWATLFYVVWCTLSGCFTGKSRQVLNIDYKGMDPLLKAELCTLHRHSLNPFFIEKFLFTSAGFTPEKKFWVRRWPPEKNLFFRGIWPRPKAFFCTSKRSNMLLNIFYTKKKFPNFFRVLSNTLNFLKVRI
jgi:hypothetical protein